MGHHRYWLECPHCGEQPGFLDEYVRVAFAGIEPDGFPWTCEHCGERVEEPIVKGRELDL